MWILWEDMRRIEREVDRLFEEMDRFLDRAFRSPQRMIGSARPEPMRGPIRPRRGQVSEHYEVRWLDPRGRWQAYAGGSYTIFEESPGLGRRRGVRRVIPVEGEDSERDAKEKSGSHPFNEADIQDVAFEEVD